MLLACCGGEHLHTVLVSTIIIIRQPSHTLLHGALSTNILAYVQQFYVLICIQQVLFSVHYNHLPMTVSSRVQKKLAAGALLGQYSKGQSTTQLDIW